MVSFDTANAEKTQNEIRLRAYKEEHLFMMPLLLFITFAPVTREINNV